MNNSSISEKAKQHLLNLCENIRDRRVGGEGNRKATLYFKQQFQKAGWYTEETLLSVIDWKSNGASLTSGQLQYEVYSSPYSAGCNVEGELVPVENYEELRQLPISGKIVLLHGKIASEQIMPKNFVFYNPEEHQQLIALLETSKPKALICATGRNASLAGGVYPFPMFEDGDFNIPSVFMKDREGEKLCRLKGATVSVVSEAGHLPSTAYNVIARKGAETAGRIVITAHIDAKAGTPGAIDNATGVAVLLLLAELLHNYDGKYSLEVVAFNGEDYYAAPGQMKYIEQNQGRFGDVILNINIDGAGYYIGPSCFSAFNLPDKVQNDLDAVIDNHPHIERGIPWVQGDHSIFVQSGCPAIAVSSSWLIQNMDVQDITHTTKDNLQIVSVERVTECALAINELIRKLAMTGI